MKLLKYFFEFIFIYILFLIFKIIGYKNSSNLGEKIGKFFGPFTRSKKKIINNLKDSNIGVDDLERETIIKKMWGNYGRILAEYPFLKKFKNNSLEQYIEIEGKEYLEEIKKDNRRVVFVSGHFNNFELMAMQLENSGLNIAAIYRPLNNVFLNRIMEKIRLNDICKKQIKKGKSGTRELLQLFKDGYSIALMIDQRVSEGIKSKLFKRSALTTTIPAQLVKKYGVDVVPIYIERKEKVYFKMYVNKPINFKKNVSLEEVTETLNQELEKMILKKPDQWIWSHDRWK
jgi:KDO2-lipid IV(A) lauroyltransferase|tara:strand:+ start:6315 stop:7175 length:861 start_codon:yes stop_codon:yes gene_type:complete